MKKRQKTHVKNSPQKKYTSTGNSTFFYILIRSWNAFDCFDRCIDSVFSQTYNNYQIIFIDDASDYSIVEKKYIKEKLRGHIAIFNKKRKFALQNAYDNLHRYATNDDAVVVSLDGDDWLAGVDSLATLAQAYKIKNPSLTYGDCYLFTGKSPSKVIASRTLPYTNIPYPNRIKNKKLYWRYPFLPLHLLTWQVGLFKKIPKWLLCHRSKFYCYLQDLAIFLPLLNLAGDKVLIIQTPLVVYNTTHPNNSGKNDSPALRMQEEYFIRKKISIWNKTENKFLFQNEIKICYSKLLSIPVVNTIIYCIEILLLKTMVLHTVFISKKNNFLREKLLSELEKIENKNLRITNYKLANLFFTNFSPIILDIEISKVEIEKFTQSEWYDLMWSFVLADQVTKKSQRTVSQLKINNQRLTFKL